MTITTYKTVNLKVWSLTSRFIASSIGSVHHRLSLIHNRLHDEYRRPITMLNNAITSTRRLSYTVTIRLRIFLYLSINIERTTNMTIMYREICK